MKWVITLFDVITAILTLTLLFIIVLGLMNTLWISIKERTGEIGTMRAMGIQQNTVLWLFLIESLLLTSISTFFGIVFGTGLSFLLNIIKIPINQEALRVFLMNDTLVLYIHWSNVILIFFSITLITSLGSFFPARRAAKMKPVTAIGAIE
jgi:putative ABC transport system permease protein